jgi:hypothetical protein
VFSNLLPGKDSVVAICCSGNVVTEPLLGNGRPLRLHYFGLQPSCENIVAHLLRARTVEPQKQPLLRNTRMQQYENEVIKSVSRQRFSKHYSAYRAVLCNAVTSSKIRTVFSVGLCRVLIREANSEARSS